MTRLVRLTLAEELPPPPPPPDDPPPPPPPPDDPPPDEPDDPPPDEPDEPIICLVTHDVYSQIYPSAAPGFMIVARDGWLWEYKGGIVWEPQYYLRDFDLRNEPGFQCTVGGPDW